MPTPFRFPTWRTPTALLLHPQGMNEPVPDGVGEYCVGEIEALGPRPHKGRGELFRGLRSLSERRQRRSPKARPA